jgi:myosin-18
MEMERMRQTHSKEMESRDEEVEEARQSCQKKVWHLDTYYSSLITILK